MRCGGSRSRVGGTHRVPQLREGVAARNRADKQCMIRHRVSNEHELERKIVGCVQRSHRDNEVVADFLDSFPIVHYIDAIRQGPQPFGPVGNGARNEQRMTEAAAHEQHALETIFERALVKEQLGPDARRAFLAQRQRFRVEQFWRVVSRHCGACALALSKRQEAVTAILRIAARWALDFALPPRCAGCGTIVAEVHSFCTGCWKEVEFLGESGCSTCGLPLPATEQSTCGVCLARPPRIERTRAAVAYDELSRSLAIRLKYGRKVAIARTMARYMAPLIGQEGERLLVPVPLHRTRLWSRGFNQSALVAHELSRRLKIATDPFVLRRVRRTPALKGMSGAQRRKTVAGAFRVRHREAIVGKTVILVDDVLTTGSTADSCARALKRAGAARVELISWARVVKPSQLMR